MPKLVKHNDIASETFVDLISNNPIVVYEEVQGSPLYVQWDGQQMQIKPRNLSNDVLNAVDLAIQKYYGPCFQFFNDMEPRIKSLMPKNWWFEFEYFFDTTPAHIQYEVMPQNGLILTGIIKGKKRTWNIQEITEYANLFNVTPMPILFNGTLNDKQLEVIKYFLNTTQEDLDFIFDENNFAYFFYKIMNPAAQNSLLMKPGNFQDNIEKLVIKIPNEKQELNFAILNPLYTQHTEADEEKTDFVDTYSIILLNFLENCQLVNLDEISFDSNKKSDMYLELLSYLFNTWMEHTKNSFNNFEFAVPKFFKETKFKVNTTNISNAKTKKYIENDEKKEYAFRSILGSFQRPRKKPIGIFTKTSVDLFNDMVFKIDSRLEQELKMKRDEVLRNKDLLNFGDFEQVTYDEDAAGEVYPDLYSKAEEFGSDKKGKGKFPSGLKK